jgi:predicted ArsR family transcriptional regulator
MAGLGVTDNAVRAQLLNLHQEGFVRPAGLRAGTRKPHVEYELTAKGRKLLPGAYEPVLQTFIDVLHERLAPQLCRSLMKEVALKVIGPLVGELRERGPQKRASELLRKLNAAGRGVVVEDNKDTLHIRACNCPLASVTASHPEVCDLLSEVLSEALGTTVRERCDRQNSPRCRFQVAKTHKR